MTTITITKEQFDWLKDLAIRGCELQMDEEVQWEPSWKTLRDTAISIQPMFSSIIVAPDLRSKTK